MSLGGSPAQPSRVFSLMCFRVPDLLQGLHGPPGDKGNRVSLTPHPLALVTNVFMMWWNDQSGIPGPTWQIQLFLINRCKLKGLLVRGLICSLAGSLGPDPEIEACIFPPDKGGQNPTAAVRLALPFRDGGHVPSSPYGALIMGP